MALAFDNRCKDNRLAFEHITYILVPVETAIR